MNLIQFVADNWVALTAALTAIFVAAKEVAKLTPTKKDDEIIDRLISVEKIVEEIFVKDPSKAPTQAITVK